MTADLAAFLTARLDEIKQTARAATPGPWQVDDPSYPEAIVNYDGHDVASGGRWGGEARIFNCDADAVHIALHDPAFVLANVAAKKAIIKAHDYGWISLAPGKPEEPACSVCAGPGGRRWATWPCRTLRLLAQPFRDHPEWSTEWDVK
jgi:hypothetical protein